MRARVCVCVHACVCHVQTSLTPPDDQILADLLTHEARSEVPKERLAEERSEYSGSESDDEMEDVESSDEEEGAEFVVRVSVCGEGSCTCTCLVCLCFCGPLALSLSGINKLISIYRQTYGRLKLTTHEAHY